MAADERRQSESSFFGSGCREHRRAADDGCSCFMTVSVFRFELQRNEKKQRA